MLVKEVVFKIGKANSDGKLILPAIESEYYSAFIKNQIIEIAKQVNDDTEIKIAIMAKESREEEWDTGI